MSNFNLNILSNFNPRSLAGATGINNGSSKKEKHFNPRSLAGATQQQQMQAQMELEFQSTLPRGSDGATIWLTRY